MLHGYDAMLFVHWMLWSETQARSELGVAVPVVKVRMRHVVPVFVIRCFFGTWGVSIGLRSVRPRRIVRVLGCDSLLMFGESFVLTLIGHCVGQRRRSAYTIFLASAQVAEERKYKIKPEFRGCLT